MERKLASVRKILSVDPIEGADKIEVVTVDGWKVVAQKGLYKPGDLAVYFEVDSFLPIREQYEFLRKSCFKSDSFLGEGFRIKTIKLRGQISQGMLMPMYTYFKLDVHDQNWYFEEEVDYAQEGDDLTELLGIKKWEPTITAENAKGRFPEFIPKTDQERWQNLTKHLPKWQDIAFEISEKLEGSSITIFMKDGEFRVCSRNLEVSEESKFYQAAIANGFKEKLESISRIHGARRVNIAVQGELVGPGVQKNYYDLKTLKIYVFDIFNIDTQEYLNDIEKMITCEMHGISQTPTIDITELKEYDYTKFDFKSKINPEKIVEGVVLKSFDRAISFKSINPEYLLKTEN